MSAYQDSAPASPAELLQRTRFDAVRRRIFEEMGRSAARWRLTWLLPFYIVILTLLVVRGEAGAYSYVQGGTVAVIAGLFIARVFWDHLLLRVGSFMTGVLCYFILVATTGCLASPLVVTGALMITAAAITLRDPPWLRTAVFLSFLGGFVGLAILSRTPLGQLRAPLNSADGWSSPEYVSIALLSAVFTMMGVYRVGCGMTHGYERAALELAERREELCSENEDRTRALEGMAARLAHEVKNPLAAIKGLSTHMARSATDPKTAERLAIVAAEADRLQSIVDGFLSFSRGLEDLKPAPTKLHEVARELLVLLETRAQDAGIALELSGDESLLVEADARKVRQALLNLVLNAIQASPKGSGVSINIGKDCGGARIVVEDSGLGMTADVLERIRKPYFTTKEGGTGLGVAVARGLIEQHGGRLDYKSAAGKGTAVTIRLPTRAVAGVTLPNLMRSTKRDCEERERAEIAARDSALTS